MRLSRRFTMAAGVLALCGTAFTLTSCSLGPQDLPSVGSGGRDGYDVTLHFANVMNLPPGAYVMMNGLRVGQVGAVDDSGSDVGVDVRLAPGTHVSRDARAVIRQDTLLGDTYIALDNDTSTADRGFLPPGGTIPASRTTSPPTPEDTLAVLAYFVNGGSIQKLEDVMGRINTVMPRIGDVRRLASVTASDIGDLSRNTTDVDQTLDGFDRTAVALDAKSATLNRVLFNPAALHYWRSIANAEFAHVSTVLPSIGSIFQGGSWMIPLLDSLADIAGSGREIYDSAPTAVDKISTFLRTVVLPFAQHPSVDIRSVSAGDGDQAVGDMENVLRMLGAMK